MLILLREQGAVRKLDGDGPPALDLVVEVAGRVQPDLSRRFAPFATRCSASSGMQ